MNVVVVTVLLYLFQHVYLSLADVDLTTQGDALKNLNSYGLNARTRFALGRYVLCQLSAGHSFEVASTLHADCLVWCLWD